jgi:hypothetical protein
MTSVWDTAREIATLIQAPEMTHAATEEKAIEQK